MSLSAPFIQRPVATWLLALSVFLGGMLGYRFLPVSALPQVDFPTIQVSTELPGASPETMTALVTTPLERQLGQVPGLMSMNSVGSMGLSTITLQFALNKSLDSAAQEVQAAINAARGVLPTTLPHPPVYSKVNPAETPVMTLALTSDTMPITQVNDVADTLFAQKLAQVSGVGRVSIGGGQKPAYRVQLDPNRLAAYGIGMDEVRTALTKANVDQPKGTLDGATQALTIGANDQIADRATFERLILTWRNGAPVRLTDVGQLVEGIENAQTQGWFNGKPAVIIQVRHQPGANIVQTTDRVRTQLPDLSRSAPAGIDLSVVADRTQTIRASVADVQFTLALTVGLVVLVIHLFLKSWRATLIPAVALPLSLVGTFGIMAGLGFSLDNLSLMALTIAAGFVVDDAIVMIENIVRYLEQGDPPLLAARKGAAEIGFTIVSLTVSLVAVFIPLLFMTGIVGRLFREFALTLSIAVVVSALVSLTLTPMMCAHLLKGHDREETGGRWFSALTAFYGRTLTVVLRHRGATLLVFLSSLVLTVILYVQAPKGFLPAQDTGLIIATTDARAGISFSALQRLQIEAAQALADDPDVAAIASFLGVGEVNSTANSGQLTIALKPKSQRRDDINATMARMAAKVAALSGLDIHFRAAQDFQIGAKASRTQYQYQLSDIDPKRLEEWGPKVMAELSKVPFIADLASDKPPMAPALRVEIDRDQAARLNVTAQAVADLLHDSFGQRQVTTIFSQANQYRVILEALPEHQSGAHSLAALYVKASDGAMVPLSAIARFAEMDMPLVVSRQDQFPAQTLSFNLTKGASLSDAVAAIHAISARIGLPDTIQSAFVGDAAEFLSSLEDEPWLILAALVVIYIVLGILYESTVHPVTIMSTLPSAGIGALLALTLAGLDLSLVGLVGIILLMGIVKKNAIMMVDFALEAEKTGKSPDHAIYQACLLRFRPIMMTTMAALLGALPLAIDSGTGAELRRPLGIAIVGGLILSQILTLYTTPVIYLALDRLRTRKGA